MHEDTLSFTSQGAGIYAYGLSVMLGCWLAMLALLLLCRKSPKEKLAAAWTAFLSLPLGFLVARLVYGLLDPVFQPFLSLRNLLTVTTGGFSMFGALLGAFIAGLLAARIAGVKPLYLLDRLALALLAFLVPSRLGEGFTALGISRPLTTPWLAGSFLALQDQFDAYLRTYLLEAAIAALLFFCLLRVLRGGLWDGAVLTRFCLLFGLSQTLMESLRYDGHLRYSFIGVQQVLAAALFSLALVYIAVRALKQGRGLKALPIFALALLPVILGAIVGIEFLIDRSELGKLFSYLLYILALAIPGTLGILMLKREESLGQRAD